MEFIETGVKGAFLIKPDKMSDDRGFFARAWCVSEMLQQGLAAVIKQSNMAVSTRKGTLRGLHFQKAPHQEAKFLRCVRGAMFDVVIDVRADSPTHRKWFGTELNQNNHHALYVPEGCATGYLTLADDTEMYYHTSEHYHPESATGIRYDDPAFAIQWPATPVVISEQDCSWPAYE